MAHSHYSAQKHEGSGYDARLIRKVIQRRLNQGHPPKIIARGLKLTPQQLGGYMKGLKYSRQQELELRLAAVEHDVRFLLAPLYFIRKFLKGRRHA